MSSSLIVEVCEIKDIKEHPHADLLEVAIIKGWECITKKGEYKDFSGREIMLVSEAIETLKKNMQQIIIKGKHGTDKKTKKPLYFFYMSERPLIIVDYLYVN